MRCIRKAVNFFELK